ncbi:hypothetical protein HWV62_17020 [Athelia sp. TMB]|nr:hypothetical protein HWV62_17020 [Athelia sp. TMB]
MDWADLETKEGLAAGTITVTGDSWPMFLYEDSQYEEDNPWKGLLRGHLLVKAFRHVFTSSSSVDKDASKATCCGNTQLHRMTCTTKGSLAYKATQVQFALCSAAVFARTDTVTDSERFYISILELLEDPAKAKEVRGLLTWWDRREKPIKLELLCDMDLKLLMGEIEKEKIDEVDDAERMVKGSGIESGAPVLKHIKIH